MLGLKHWRKWFARYADDWGESQVDWIVFNMVEQMLTGGRVFIIFY